MFVMWVWHDPVMRWMVESDLVVRIPQQWVVGGVLKNSVDSDWVSGTFRYDYYCDGAWRHGSQPNMDQDSGPSPLVVQSAHCRRGVEALGALLSELAKAIEFWIAREKSKGTRGRRLRNDQNGLIYSL
jgi:hypothetical protein